MCSGRYDDDRGCKCDTEEYVNMKGNGCGGMDYEVKPGIAGMKYFTIDTSSMIGIPPEGNEMRKSENPKEECGRKKIPLHLNPSAALREMARAHACGAAKYGAWNWRDTEVSAMTYVGAILRHLYAYVDREDTDPESGVHHLGHIMACCGVMLDAMSVGKVRDDRPK